MGTVVQGFADLEDRLLEIRRSIGLPEDGAARSSSAGSVSSVPGPVAARSVDVPVAPRRHVGDMILLGVAWSAFAALVVLAL